MPTFTQDWFSHNIAGLNQVLPQLKGRRRFLEIGCFEGLSTCWFLSHYLDPLGEMVCIDTFKGGLEHGGVDYSEVRSRFETNVGEVKRPQQSVCVLEDSSYAALARLASEGSRFDFIYVDGSHEAPDVMADACMAFPMLEPGGIMVFDDYLWAPERPIHQTPKMAVDMFLMLHHGQFEVVLLSYQLGIRKLG